MVVIEIIIIKVKFKYSSQINIKYFFINYIRVLCHTQEQLIYFMEKYYRNPITLAGLSSVTGTAE